MADAGRIQTNGSELTAFDDSARRDFRIQNIGLLFQEFELPDPALAVQQA